MSSNWGSSMPLSTSNGMWGSQMKIKSSVVCETVGNNTWIMLNAFGELLNAYCSQFPNCTFGCHVDSSWNAWDMRERASTWKWQNNWIRPCPSFARATQIWFACFSLGARFRRFFIRMLMNVVRSHFPPNFVLYPVRVFAAQQLREGDSFKFEQNTSQERGEMHTMKRNYISFLC